MTSFFFLWLVVGLFEAPFVAFLLSLSIASSFNLTFVATLHALAAFLAIFIFPKQMGWFHPERLWARSAFVLTALLPGLGWLLTGMIYFFVSRNTTTLIQRMAEDPEEADFWMDMPEKIQTPRNPEISRQDRIIRELDFISLVDVLAGNDLNIKRGAIERLCQMRTPEAVRLLLDHRNDSNADVRFFVTAAIDRIKHDYEEEFKAARQEMDKSSYKVSARVLLAKKYLEYIKSGLLDEALVETYFEEALFQLNHCVQSEYATEEAHWLLIELYRLKPLALHQEKIFQILDELERQKDHDQILIEKTRVELYFLVGRYRDMGSHLKRLSGLGELTSEWKGLLYWWEVAS